MYREKLMNALLKMDDAIVFMNGMQKELYRNQEALRSLLIACFMVLVYNAEYSELLTLAIFGQHFYKALMLVSDNYTEHNEDIHIVNVIGQDVAATTVEAATLKKEMITPPPNSPEITGFNSTNGIFAAGDAYESVENMKSTPMEEKVKEYVKNGRLDEKVIQDVIKSQKDQIMEKYSKMGLERMTTKDYDPTTLENVEGFADMNDTIETHESVNFPTTLGLSKLGINKSQESFDKRVEEYMKNRDVETTKPSLSVTSIEFDKRMEEYITNRETEKAKQLLHDEQLTVPQNEIVAA